MTVETLIGRLTLEQSRLDERLEVCDYEYLNALRYGNQNLVRICELKAQDILIEKEEIDIALRVIKKRVA